MSKEEGPDFKCCDGCLESFSTDLLTWTGNEDDLLLCSRCIEEYQLST
jgi:hypothetical protein